MHLLDDPAKVWIQDARESIAYCRTKLKTLSSESVLDELDLLADLVGAGEQYREQIGTTVLGMDSDSAEPFFETIDLIQNLETELSDVMAMLRELL